MVFVDRHGVRRRLMVCDWSFDAPVLSMRVAASGLCVHSQNVRSWQFYPLRILRRASSRLVPLAALDESAQRALLEVVR